VFGTECEAHFTLLFTAVESDDAQPQSLCVLDGHRTDTATSADDDYELSVK
jgi:hypothetical protein